MPHLLETYALNCGLKIDKPFILEKFYPTHIDKYITLHPFSKFPSKCYDYWEDVIDLIEPIISEKGIKIIQIGGKDERPMKKCHYTQGTTTIGQTAYIIKHSLLHLGVDSFPAHIASRYNKKIVGLYSNTYAKIVEPYWGEKQNQITLEPKRVDSKPSYSAEENPKTINEIKPEDIAGAALKLLGLDHEAKYETLARGPNYLNKKVEIIPSGDVDLNGINMNSAIVRMDLCFNEKILIELLNRMKCGIVTDKPINLQIFGQFKSNIDQFVYMVEKDNDINFIKGLQAAGVPFFLLSGMKQKEIDKQKFDYMDYGLIIKKETPDPDSIKEIKKHGIKNLFYKTNKLIIEKGNIYPSESAWKDNLPTNSIEPQICPVIDRRDFWAESQDFYILRKTT